MQRKATLSHVEPIKSFVYGKVWWRGEEAGGEIKIEVHPRKNGRPITIRPVMRFTEKGAIALFIE